MSWYKNTQGTSHIPRPTSPSFTSAPAMSSKVTLEENPPSVQVETRKGDLLFHPGHVKDIIYSIYSWSTPWVRMFHPWKTCIKFGKHIKHHIFHKTTWYYMKTLSYININTPALVRCQYLHPQTVKSSFPAWPKPFEMRASGGVPKRTIGWI